MSQTLLVPIKYIPIPWNQVIAKALTEDIFFSRKPNEGEFIAAYIRIFTWETSLHWLIKSEWQRKHKIPVPRAIANALKPKGKRLICLFKLCERCHSFQQNLESVRVPYKHAAFWFDSIFAEIKASEINHVLNPQVMEDSRRKDKKEGALLLERHACQMLRDYENPLADQAATYPAAFTLYEAAISLAESSDHFYYGFFKPYIRAWGADISQLDKPGSGRLFVENGQAYIKTGRGGQRQNLSLSSEAKNYFLKCLCSGGFKT